MQADNCPAGVLKPVLDRIHLDSLGSPGFYRAAAEHHGLCLKDFAELTEHLITHYSRVRAELWGSRDALGAKVSSQYVDRMLAGLGHWVDAGTAGYLCWGILHFTKPAVS